MDCTSPVSTKRGRDMATPPNRTNQYKQTTSPWRETFKSKCRLRLKANRQSLVNRLRNCSLDNSELLNEIMQEEYLALKKQTKLDNFLDESLISEEALLHSIDEIRNELLAEQAYHDSGDCYYEELTQPLTDAPVICPLCQKHNLSRTNCLQGIYCVCGLSFKTGCSLRELGDVLEVTSEMHSDQCRCNPLFAIIEDNQRNMLTMQCIGCNFYNIILTDS